MFYDDYNNDPEGTAARIAAAVADRCGVAVQSAEPTAWDSFSVVVDGEEYTDDAVEQKTTEAVIETLCGLVAGY